MLKETSTCRFPAQSTSRSSHSETNENEFEASQSLIPYPPPRTPLNSIADPSQYHKESIESDADAHPKLNRACPLTDRKFEAPSCGAGYTGLNLATPRASRRGRKDQSETNSAQSTPARNVSRFSLGGAVATSTGYRAPPFSGVKGGSSSRDMKGILVPNSEFSTLVPQFELKEDPSFWMDHNVQVLIRIRPINTLEKVSQGYSRCLRQESAMSLVWLGNPETRFTFDHIACEAISQENLFRVVGVPMVENCLSGYNSCMFAYGQTGSGKTYTMMGDIYEIEGKLNEARGITPRIFEYLFMRIGTEEEKRENEKLKFSCKCSFLEIYNEQITDLLEPSSTNLQLREDLKKGVYVESLSEHSVSTVNNVLKLLLQGAANRKVAATHMNSESSRSHSVFTCTVESHWEKDSLSHLRFARLNIVDLAGSERQKSSCVEGDRLRETANINKSLSTLGLVIMTLADLAHGKSRHVPYRDSRLTFLLQDSLGGNSKTTIIANIRPSICSANETLSTLKFAQRAKLIQNNAKVNEDASGDVTALQQQIQHLKDQLSSLMEHKNFSSSMSSSYPNFEHVKLSDFSYQYNALGENIMTDSHHMHLQNQEIKCMKETLIGALRREKMAESTVRKLKVELERMNSLVCQREEDAQNTEMKLRFHEKKIEQLELLVNGALSAETYLMEENKALQDQIQLLQAGVKSDPELTRYQTYYEQGERERLLAEICNLRDQLLVILDGNHTHTTKNENQENHTMNELDTNDALARQVFPIEDTHRRNNTRFLEKESIKDKVEEKSVHEYVDYCSTSGELENNSKNLLEEEKDRNILQDKLEKITMALEEVRLLNDQHQEKQTLQLSHQYQIEFVREEVEMETTKTILNLQEEVAALQSELHERFHFMMEENSKLQKTVAAKEEEIRALPIGWEKSVLELTNFLIDGCRSLKDASSQVESITCSFPQVNGWIGEHVAKAVKVYLEKEETIEFLQKSLEDAQQLVMDMELKIICLKGATVALSEYQQLNQCESSEDAFQLGALLKEKTHIIKTLECELENRREQASKMEKRFEAILLVVKWLCDYCGIAHVDKDASISELGVHTKLHWHFTAETDSVHNYHALHYLKTPDEKKKYGVSLTETDDTVNCFKGNSELYTIVAPRTKANEYLKFENKHKLLLQIKYELAEMNERLKVIAKGFRTNVNSSIDTNSVDPGTWSTDCSSPESDFSSASVSPRDKRDGSSYAQSFNCSERTIEQRVNINFEGCSILQADSQASGKSEQFWKNSVCDGAEILCLKRELDTAHDTFNELYVRLSAVLEDEEGTIQPSSAKEGEGGHDNRVKWADQKINSANGFITKFEEVRATIKEADIMLNALIKANDNAKQVNDMWKQAGVNFMREKTSLTEEIQQLKSSVHSKDEENKLLMCHGTRSLNEITQSLLFLEQCFLQMQSNMESRFKAMHSDVYSMGKEMMCFIKSLRLSLEDIWSQIIENGLLFYLLQDCHNKVLCKVLCSNTYNDVHLMRQREMNKLREDFCGCAGHTTYTCEERKMGKDENLDVKHFQLESGYGNGKLMHENLILRKELSRKEELLEGLLFDFQLLQESASNSKDVKDETEKLMFTLCQVRHELETKTSLLDEILEQNRKLQNCLADKEELLSITNSEIEHTEETINKVLDQNSELRWLLEGLHVKRTEAEEELEEHKEVIKGLENEILHMTSSLEKKSPSLENIEDDLRQSNSQRYQLQEEIRFLNDKLEMANALADENEALAMEARQESAVSKIFAEEKEQEVKILEHSIQELEGTINMLEKKVYEMDEEVGRHRLIRNSLEEELQALRQRLSLVGNGPQIEDSETLAAQENEEHLPRDTLLEFHKAQKRIKLLKEEIIEKDREIKQCKEHLSEVVLHAEAQALQYQDKYKTLESMLLEVKTELSNSKPTTASSVGKPEKSSMRPRGSSSPFRCISSLVQQMNVEKDQELTKARLRMEELEALAASRQKEVCILSARLAAVENMTHDVIRDLLGLKLDMTNYAQLVEQHQVLKLMEEAQRYTEEFFAKEEEILSLRKQIRDLMEEKESYAWQVRNKEAEVLDTQIALEQFQERDQLLSAQNEILKTDKTNLMKKVAELDEMVKSLLGNQQHIQQTSRIKGNGPLKLGEIDIAKRLACSDQMPPGVNRKLAQHYRSGGSTPRAKYGGTVPRNKTGLN